MTINLVHLLVGFLIFLLVAYGARLIIRQLAAPPPVETIVMLILLVVFIVWLLSELGIGGPVIHIGSASFRGGLV
jgi:energy-coupling factor transporter transmembrane protein EcfT